MSTKSTQIISRPNYIANQPSNRIGTTTSINHNPLTIINLCNHMCPDRFKNEQNREPPQTWPERDLSRGTLTSILQIEIQKVSTSLIFTMKPTIRLFLSHVLSTSPFHMPHHSPKVLGQNQWVTAWLLQFNLGKKNETRISV